MEAPQARALLHLSANALMCQRMKDSYVRVTINLPTELAWMIDDYWHTERLTNRQAAIRDLLAYAIGHKTGAIQPRGYGDP